MRTYVIVIHDKVTHKVEAARYETDRENDWLVFYGDEGQVVAQFNRWNILGFYVQT